MSQWPSHDRDNVIRITKEDAYTPHVDDLLKRQMSLRGEPGITRTPQRRWYYQNWFVFMLSGALAALAAWAIIEPYFDDMLYLQGRIERVDTSAQAPPRLTFGEQYLELTVPVSGTLQINNEQIWLHKATKLLQSNGNAVPLDVSLLTEGEQIGAHVEYIELGSKGISVAHFVVRDPPAQSLEVASMSIERLNARSQAMGILLFPLVAGLIGLAIGSADGIICRLPRRVLLAGAVGLLAGFIGGFLSGLVAGLVYLPLNTMAMKQQGDIAAGLSTFGFFVQLCGRALAWCVAGMAMGLGQGIALRSGRLTLYGFLGGIVGGLLGGLLFDPIDLLILGIDKPSAHWSRLIGFMVIGASVGCMIGVVELLARDAWLQMTEGPLAGKEFLIFKDTMRVGCSPRSDIYLFNDPAVAQQHAVIRAVGENYEIENQCEQEPVHINGRPIQSSRLRHGDQIAIGQTAFIFQKRRG